MGLSVDVDWVDVTVVVGSVGVVAVVWVVPVDCVGMDVVVGFVGVIVVDSGGVVVVDSGGVVVVDCVGVDVVGSVVVGVKSMRSNLILSSTEKFSGDENI